MKRLALTLLLAASFASRSFAAGPETIDQLGPAATITGAELVPVFQGANPALGASLSAIISALVGISAGCGNTTGGSAVQIGSINATMPPVALTGTNPPIVTGYCGQLVRFNNAANQVPTIARAGSAGFPTGWFTTLCNIGAGTQTITPATGTIAGQANYVLAAGSPTAPVCIGITSDGTSDYNLVVATSFIAAGITPTTGITSGDLISSSSNQAADSGIATVNVMTLSGVQTITGAKTFNNVFGKVSTQSGTTYTFAAADCGTSVRFTSGTTVTATIPATLAQGCIIAVEQAGAGTVAVNGTAVSAATLHTHVNSGTATGTAGQWAVIGIFIETNTGTAVAILTGDGA